MGFLQFILILQLNTSFAQDIDLSKCSQQLSKENTLKLANYRPVQSTQEAQEDFEGIYSNPLRLKDRFFWSADLKSVAALKKNNLIAIPSTFIKNVKQQLELALSRGYADFIYYADLGHAHILISDTTQKETPLSTMLSTAEIKLLYHTAELYQFREGNLISGPLTQDTWLQWRYYSRNFVATNDGRDDLAVMFEPPPAIYNTVRSLPNMTEVATIYISANINGCFTFKNKEKIINFDMTFSP